MRCRICYEEGGAAFVRPCACCGSMAYVHYNCLCEWLKRKEGEAKKQRRTFERNNVQCNVCKTRMDIQYALCRKPLTCERASKKRNIIAYSALSLIVFAFSSLAFIFSYDSMIESVQQKNPTFTIIFYFVQSATGSFMFVSSMGALYNLYKLCLKRSWKIVKIMDFDRTI